MIYLIGEDFIGEKLHNFSEVTNISPDENFPRRKFSPTNYFPRRLTFTGDKFSP